MKPLVSILIPVYNAESWLGSCINSAINQTYPYKEILIFDDGSLDNSYDIAKKYECENIKVSRSETNKGQSATLNKLHEIACGDFIQYLDADDILDPGKIEHQIRCLKESRSDLTLYTCKWSRFYQNDLSTSDFFEHPDYQDYKEALQWLLDSWNGKGTMPPTAWLIPRKVAEETGPWNEELTLKNDNEYYSRMVLKADKIIYCPDSRYYYRFGITSVSSRKDRKAYESFFNMCEISTKNLIEYENTGRTRNACANLWQSFIYEVYPGCEDLRCIAESQIIYYGGSNLKLPFGKKVNILSNILGWKLSKRLQNFYYKLKK